MGQTLVITGTGTGLGKTTVSLGTLAWAKEAGLKAIWYKPVQCGQGPLPGTDRLGGDAEWLGAFLPESQRHVGLSLKLAASPHLAARAENKKVEIQQLAAEAEALRNQCDLLIIEGAGGVAVPFNLKGQGLCDLTPPSSIWWMVTAPGLGTLSHTRSAACFLETQNKKLSGFVFSNTSPEKSQLTENNRETLEELLQIPCCGEIDYLDALNEKGPLSRNPKATLTTALHKYLSKLFLPK